jgi:hypothetical protein
MNDDDKITVTLLILAFLAIASLVITVNWRWRANIRSYTENGYVQKQVPSSYKTIWVIDPNATKK